MQIELYFFLLWPAFVFRGREWSTEVLRKAEGWLGNPTVSNRGWVLVQNLFFLLTQYVYSPLFVVAPVQ